MRTARSTQDRARKALSSLKVTLSAAEEALPEVRIVLLNLDNLLTSILQLIDNSGVSQVHTTAYVYNININARPH